MSFVNKLKKLKKSYLKDLLNEEINKSNIHACRVIDFPNGKFPKGWMDNKNTLVKSITELNEYNIITRPNRLLVIEFDKNGIEDYEVIRNSAICNINLITEFLDSIGIYYLVSDHNKYKTSYSPHLYILFSDLPIGNNHSFRKFNERMRIFFIYYLNSKLVFDARSKMDLNFCNLNGNMPLIFQIHWKGKHKGAVQELIKESDNDNLVSMDFIINNYVKSE